MRAHLRQEVAQIRDFRLFRRVFDARCAFRQCRRHQDILRRADAGKIKVDIAAAQFSAQGDEPRRLLDVRAEGFHALQVQVNRTLTNCAATGQRNPRITRPRQQRPHYQHRRAHSAEQILPARRTRGIRRHHQQFFRLIRVHQNAAVAQNIRESFHIRQRRNLLDGHGFPRQQRAAHQGQHRVFCRMHGDFARQARTGSNAICRHVSASSRFILPGASGDNRAKFPCKGAFLTRQPRNPGIRLDFWGQLAHNETAFH